MRARISPISNAYRCETGASGIGSPSTHRCTSASRPAQISSGIGIPAANRDSSGQNGVLQLGYLVVFALLAQARLSTKDILS